jgi:hypothetical protein
MTSLPLVPSLRSARARIVAAAAAAAVSLCGGQGGWRGQQGKGGRTKRECLRWYPSCLTTGTKRSSKCVRSPLLHSRVSFLPAGCLPRLDLAAAAPAMRLGPLQWEGADALEERRKTDGMCARV